MKTRIGDSKELGSCNACHKQTGPQGTISGEVVEVSLNYLCFRLCRECSEELVNRLGVKPTRETRTGWGG
jgi:hypothetical protein